MFASFHHSLAVTLKAHLCEISSKSIFLCFVPELLDIQTYMVDYAKHIKLHDHKTPLDYIQNCVFFPVDPNS